MADTRTKNSIKNIIASMTYQIINLIISFVNRSIFIQVLGVSYLGISGLFNDVLSMLNLAELGFGTAMTYSMYKPLAEKDYDTLAGLTHFYKKVYRIIAAIIFGMGIILIPFLTYIINLEQNIPHIELYYLLFLMSNVASYFVTYKTTILYADQKNYILIKYTSYWSIAQTVLLILTLLLTHNYMLYLILQVICVYGANFHKSFVAQKTYPYINKEVKLPKAQMKTIFKDVYSAFVYKIAIVLISATDNTLISILVSTEMVGYYSNYNIIIVRLTSLIGTIFSSLIASLGNLLAIENSQRRYHVFQVMQSLSLILSAFCVSCLLLLEEDFIRVWLGNEYTLGYFSLLVIVFNFYFSIITRPVSTFREAAGLFRTTKYIALGKAILNIILSIILGKIIGLVGILLATSISALVTNFWYEPILLYRNYFEKKCNIYFVDLLKNIAITFVTILVAYFTSSWLIPRNWFELLIKGVIVAVTSCVFVLWSYRKSEGVKYLLFKAKKIKLCI